MKNIIAVIFDFDDTLAPDATSALLESLGVDVKDFWQNRIKKLMDDDWDPVPAYLSGIIDLSQNRETVPITKELLFSFGRGLSFYKGVTRFFSRVRSYMGKKYPDINLEFYLISSGLREILVNTKIAGNFTDIWACDFVYDETGQIRFPKNIISFTDKTRYLFQISKGIIGPASRGQPFEVNRKLEADAMRIPFEQMIFIGDGYTDIPCFSLIKKYNGYSFGVYDRDKRDRWGKAWGFIEDGRVTNLLSADYSASSDLSNSVIMALDSIARRIELKNTLYEI